MNGSFRITAALACALLLALAGSANAQTTLVNANVVGTVTDAQGAVIPGVTVTATNLATNISAQAVTDDEGRYRLASLIPGEYELKAELAGFRSYVLSKVKLEVNQTARFDIKLQVGEISDKVEVVGEAALLKTDTPELGNVIYEKLIQELPLNGRSYLQLAGLTTGATGGSGTYTTIGSYAASYNGMHTLQNQYQLDGGDNTSLEIMVPVVRPPLDSIREFQVQTTSYSAEYGRTAGAVISAVTKTGTNQFHGSAWEFFRNEVLDARNFFAPTRPPYKQNQFGATFGGPVLKDRMFFFASWESARIRQGVPRTATVPTLLERQGDFSQSTRVNTGGVIYDPFNLDATGQRIPFEGGRIPASRINPNAAKIAQYYPLPNNPGFPNYSAFPTLTDDNDKFMGRVDYKLNDRDSFFARYAWETQPRFDPGGVPGFTGIFYNPSHGHNVSASWNRIMTPKIVNEFRGGVTRRRAIQDPEHHGTNYNAQLGYDNAARLPEGLYGFPGLTITNYTGIGGSQYSDFPTWNVQFADTLAWTKGRHSMKFGFSYNWTTEARNFYSLGGTSSTFSGFYTGALNAARTGASQGQPYADLLLGVSDASGGLTAEAPGLFTPRRQLYNWFFQDNWELSTKLTLSLGLRYELNLPAYFANGRGAAYIKQRPTNECTAFMTLGGEQVCRDIIMVFPANAREPMSQLLNGQTYGFPHEFRDDNYLFDKDLNNFAPRIGIAWRPTPKTVIRTGYGVFYDVGVSNLFTNMGLAAPFYATNTISFDRARVPSGAPGNEFGKVPVFPAQFDLSLAPENGGYIQSKWAEQDYVDGYAQSWNFNVQRLVSRNLSVQVGYVGNKSTHYPTAYALNIARPGPGNQQNNRPWPRLFSCDCFHSFGSGTYHSAQMEVEQRFSAGLSFRGGYTFGKSINDFRWRRDEFAGQDAKALADWHRAQAFYLTGVYELPFMNSAQGISAGLFKGWQLSGIVSLQSGGWFSALTGSDVTNQGSRATIHPNRVANGNLEEEARTVERWFDTTAFVAQPANTYGTSGHNVLEGDGIANVDLGLSKRWTWAESQFIQFRAEFFNAFNHPTFSFPAAGVLAGGYGRVTTASQGRQVQFGLKYAF